MNEEEEDNLYDIVDDEDYETIVEVEKMGTELESMVLMGENIILKADAPVEDGMTASGIIVKKTGRAKTSKWGTVVKTSLDDKTVKVGDRILLWGITVGEIEFDGIEYLMAMSSKLLAIIPKK